MHKKLKNGKLRPKIDGKRTQYIANVAPPNCPPGSAAFITGSDFHIDEGLNPALGVW